MPQAAASAAEAPLTLPARGEMRAAKPDPLPQLRTNIADLAELASLLSQILGDTVEQGLGQGGVADRTASLRRLSELLTTTSGPNSAAARVYSLPQARLLADKFMTRFERLLRDAGDGSAEDMLPVVLLTSSGV